MYLELTYWTPSCTNDVKCCSKFKWNYMNLKMLFTVEKKPFLSLSFNLSIFDWFSLLVPLVCDYFIVLKGVFVYSFIVWKTDEWCSRILVYFVAQPTRVLCKSWPHIFGASCWLITQCRQEIRKTRKQTPKSTNNSCVTYWYYHDYYSLREIKT